MDDLSSLNAGTSPGLSTRERFAPYLPLFLRSRGDDWDHVQVEASLIFVDISGFTALSERFAQRGKPGTEELTLVLNAVFGRLLERSSKRGGDLLKFGGDALLVMFTGEGHTVRAAAAAHEMQSELRRTSRSAGAGQLRMSVGVHAGAFDLFLAGTSHRELIITGPGATVTALMEQTAEADEILLSSAASALVPEQWLAAEKGPGILLVPNPSTARVAFSAATLPQGDLTRFVPVGLRPYLGTSAAEGEHRRVVVAFLKFGGVDALLSAAGPNYVQRQLHQFVSLVQEACAAHEICFLASDVNVDGGKIILITGAPVVTPDDDERMLLGLRQIVDAEPALDLRIGVQRGQVFAGDIGGTSRRTYTVMGDAVNTAARIMVGAANRQVLATPAVPGAARTLFALTPFPPMQAKGKAEPIPTVAVGGVRGPAPREASGYPLVGRERELGVLLSALADTRSGHGQVVEIRGETGIGKTRLIEELIDRAGDLRVIQFLAERYSANTPFFTFQKVLGALIGGRSPSDAARRLERAISKRSRPLLPWLPLIAGVAGLPAVETPESRDLAPQFRRSQEHLAVLEFMRAELPLPTLLVFEDSYYMDPASRALLEELIREGDRAPWLICVISNPEHPLFVREGSGQALLEVGPLDDSGAQSLFRAAIGGAPTATAETALFERAQGNPLFLLELASAAARGAGGSELPETVEALIAARIDQLDPARRAQLRSLAVLGTVFPIGLLEQCELAENTWRTTDADRAALGEFIEFTSTGLVRFRHRLFRDAAYEGLPYRTRHSLHARVGEALEAAGDEEADSLALHFAEAEDGPRAWRYSSLAGERAFARYANVEAVRSFHQALRFERSASRGERVGVLSSLAEAQERLGESDAADERYQQARRLSPPRSAERVRLHIRRAMLDEKQGKYREAARKLSRALASAHVIDPGLPGAASLQAEIELGLAGVMFREGRYRACAQWSTRALEHAQAKGLRRQMAHALYLLGHNSHAPGEHGRNDLLEQALELFVEVNDLAGQANTLNNLGVEAHFRGEYREALGYYRRSLQACARTGDVVEVAQRRNNIGEALLELGDSAGAEEEFRRALATFERANYQLGMAYVSANLASAIAKMGRLAEAEAALRQAREHANALNARGLSADINSRLAVVLSSRLSEFGQEILSLLPAKTTAPEHQLARARAQMALAHVEDRSRL